MAKATILATFLVFAFYMSFSTVPGAEARGLDKLVEQKTCSGDVDCIVPCPNGPGYCVVGVCKCAEHPPEISTQASRKKPCSNDSQCQSVVCSGSNDNCIDGFCECQQQPPSKPILA